MDNNKTELVFLVDRSGSMGSLKEAMEEAINGLRLDNGKIERQQAAQEYAAGWS